MRSVSLVTLALLGAVSLPAQQAAPAAPQWEGRIVPVLSPGVGALAGVGVNVRAGWYARLGLGVSAGAVRRADAWHAQQRVEGTARFMFDPFGERRRGFYAGAGIGAERDGAGRVRGLLLGVVGMEGAAAGRVVPALELTLGGGARLAVVLRARRRQGR